MTVGSHTLQVVTYLTGRELREIQSAMMEHIEMKTKGEDTEMSGFKVGMLALKEDKQIDLVVKKFDDKTDGIKDAVLDLPREEYKTVMDYIKELTEGKEPASK
jgi:hydroxymethylpyrimidine/phosphomethylpyrimidine kinase